MRDQRLKVLSIVAIAAIALFSVIASAQQWPKELMRQVDMWKDLHTAGKPMPESVPGVKTITVDEAYKMWEAKVVFLDSRPKKHYDTERIPGAVWFYDGDLIDDPSVAGKLDKGKEYVSYCGGAT